MATGGGSGNITLKYAYSCYDIQFRYAPKNSRAGLRFLKPR
jgi:hypothetical protein